LRGLLPGALCAAEVRTSDDGSSFSSLLPPHQFNDDVDATVPVPVTCTLTES
jgi:hypothetical protein